jgi:hypothetical protein
MEKNKEGVNGVIQKFAMLSDALVDMFPKAKSVVVFCLNNEDFNTTKAQVNNFDNNTTQFKIDISGTEFIFLKDELLNSSEDKISQTPS